MTQCEQQPNVLSKKTTKSMSRYTQYRPSPYSLIPPAIKWLIGLNLIVFLLQNLLPDSVGIDGLSLQTWFEVHGALMPMGSEFFYPYWQLITYQFMHAGIGHIFFNMLALWMFGSELEQIWGSVRFIVYYLLCGIGGGLLHIAIGSAGATVGASGAIMGVLIAFGMTFPNRPILMFPFFIPIPAKYFVAMYALIDLVSAASSTSDGIAHFAHIGGAVMGFLLMKFGDRIGIFQAAERFTERMQQQPSHRYDRSSNPVREARFRDVPLSHSTPPSAVFHGGSFFHKGEYITEDTVDAIYDKINRSGYESLDQREKDILMEISRRTNP